MKRLAICTMIMAIGAGSHANILVDTHIDNNENSITYSMVNTGWQSKGIWAAGSGGGLEATGADNWGVAQVVSVGANTGSDLALSFDWTPSATASGTALTLDYELIGIRVTNAAPVGTDAIFVGMNYFDTKVETDITGGERTLVVDFLAGNVPGVRASDGLAFVSSPEISSTAGVAASVNVTNSVAIGAYSDLSDYDYIGIRFGINSNDDPGILGAKIENISLTVIPEPATLGLVAAFGGGVLFVRRRFMI